LTFLYSGSCRLLFGGESLLLAEGELCIIPPMSPHNQPMDPSCLAIGIAVRSSTFDSIFGALLTNKDLVSAFFRKSLYGTNQANYLRLKTELQPEIRRLIQQLAYECNREDPYANVCAVCLLNLLLAQMMRRYSNTITMYRMDGNMLNREDFTLILRYIQQNYRTVTLASLAEVFHYNETYLCKVIQKNIGKSFSAIVRSLKMTRAQEYLTNTELKVFEIARLVGYESVDHFSRTFSKVYGVPPQEFRKEQATEQP
ncbi:MAG: AraC family transcriptional regulator, partial [Clostridia bacterium]